MIFRRSYLFTLAAFALIAIGFAAGYLTHRLLSSFYSFPVLTQAYQILNSRGINPPPEPPALEYGMIRGMLQAYNDPFTSFVEPVQHELEGNLLQGNFGGVGVRLEFAVDEHWIIFPIPGSVAESAGIQDADRLLAVDDLQVTPDMPLETIQSAIRGPVGREVRLTISRAPDYLAQVIKIKRAEIALPSVIYNLSPQSAQVGVVKVSLVAATTAEEIENAVLDLQARGATHWILDLRGNPGGLLTAGVDIARLFLKDGIVIEQQYRDQEAESFVVEKPGALSDLPLVVLIDHGSASAAELIAGSLQAHQRAILIGAPSFGKDTIQLVYDLKDGSSLHVTAARWWISGLEPHFGGVGLQPNILVEANTGESNQPDQTLQIAVQKVLELENDLSTQP